MGTRNALVPPGQAAPDVSTMFANFVRFGTLGRSYYLARPYYVDVLQPDDGLTGALIWRMNVTSAPSQRGS